MKERLKSKVVWLSVVAQILMVIAFFRPELSDGFKILSSCIIETLTLFGILNNPTDRHNF